MTSKKRAPLVFLHKKQEILAKKPAAKEEEEDVYEFSFNDFNKKYESYNGKNFKIRFNFLFNSLAYTNRYFIKVSLTSSYFTVAKAEHDILVQLPSIPNMYFPIYSIQVGIRVQDVEPMIDMILEFKKTQYYIDEPIIGKIIVNKMTMPVKEIFLMLLKVEKYRESKQVILNSLSE